jgi:hypothetical protein
MLGLTKRLEIDIIFTKVKTSQGTAGTVNTQGHPSHSHIIQNSSFPQLLGPTKWLEIDIK